MDIIQVAADHHFKHSEKFPVRDESVVVNVINLEGEAELVLLAGSRRERVKTLNELEEGNVSILVLIKHRNHTADERVLRKF